MKKTGEMEDEIHDFPFVGTIESLKLKGGKRTSNPGILCMQKICSTMGYNVLRSAQRGE